MTTKSLLMTGTLVLASFSMAYAKSYDLMFNAPVKAGNLVLKPGEYSLKLEGNTAVFKNVTTSKTFTAPVKIENSAKKHDVTTIDSIDQNGTNEIRKIELGGSATDLEFGE